MEWAGESVSFTIRGGFEDYRDFVNPLIHARAELTREPMRFVRASGGKLVTDDGRAIEDFHGAQAFGHRHAVITRVVRDFLDSDAPNWFPSRVSPFAGRLAKKLCARAGHYERVYFGCSGSDGVEAAMKLARAATRRPKILALDHAYHGCTFGAVALMHEGPFRDPFAPHLPGVERLPFDDVDALRRALAGEDVAAVIVEPIQGEGGVRELSARYIDALCTLTREHGALLLCDEVQSGMGRSGYFLRSSSWPRRPDAVILAKQLGGGLAAVSAMMTTADLFHRAYGADFEDGESHNMTMGTSAIAMVAAMAALDLLDDDLLHRIRTTGEAFRGALRESLRGSSLVAGERAVRGDGLMIGVELVQPDHPWVSFDQLGFPELEGRSTIGPIVCFRLYKRGYFCFVCGHDWRMLRLHPRFDIEGQDLATFARALREELDTIEKVV